MSDWQNDDDVLPDKKNQLRVLHTADWHIGKRFNDIQRYEEFDEFLRWLIVVLDHHAIDVLIVAGDIFDTTTPSNKSQALYYQFLAQVLQTNCRHVVIVAGNHDSPTFLQAPKLLLQHLNIHIVGLPTKMMRDEIIVLKNHNVPEAIICAVPYLRDKDIRDEYTQTDFADNQSVIESNTVTAIKAYYQDVQTLAFEKKNDIWHQYGVNVPVIATGHFFAVGANVSSEDDGMRDIGATYVGMLGAVDIGMLDFDYMALGHIHKAQMIGGQSHMRYSGSPLVMGFGECRLQKCVLVVDFAQSHEYGKTRPCIYPLVVPIFRHIVQIQGDLLEIKQQIQMLAKLPNHHEALVNISPKPILIGIDYTGKVVANLFEKLNEYIADENMIIISIKDGSIKNNYTLTKSIHDIRQVNEQEVFELVLDAHDYSDEDKVLLKQLYQYVINHMYEMDVRAI